MILFADLRVRLYVLSSEPFLALDYLSKNNKFKHFSIVATDGRQCSKTYLFLFRFQLWDQKIHKKVHGYSRIYSVSTNFTLARTHAKHTHHYLSGIEKWVSYILHRRSTAALIRVNFTLYAEGQIFYIFWGVSNGMKKLMYSPQTKKNN